MISSPSKKATALFISKTDVSILLYAKFWTIVFCSCNNKKSCFFERCCLRASICLIVPTFFRENRLSKQKQLGREMRLHWMHFGLFCFIQKRIIWLLLVLLNNRLVEGRFSGWKLFRAKVYFVSIASILCNWIVNSFVKNHVALHY